MDDGEAFPPRHWRDVAAYPLDEVVSGYTEYSATEPDPGPNRSPGYRWGWANRKRDSMGRSDGFDIVRQEYFKNKPALTSANSIPWRP